MSVTAELSPAAPEQERGDATSETDAALDAIRTQRLEAIYALPAYERDAEQPHDNDPTKIDHSIEPEWKFSRLGENGITESWIVSGTMTHEGEDLEVFIQQYDPESGSILREVSIRKQELLDNFQREA